MQALEPVTHCGSVWFVPRRFVVDQGKGPELRAALLKLEEQNKASLNVDSWYSVYHHSHPHLVERLAAIDAAVKKDS